MQPLRRDRARTHPGLRVIGRPTPSRQREHLLRPLDAEHVMTGTLHSRILRQDFVRQALSLGTIRD